MITARGSFRRLTLGEITLSRFLYKNAIDYSLVKVHNASYFPFGLQNEETAVTPNGELYWPEKHFREDFSTETTRYLWWFMHEMAHVWQYQMGMNVRLRGIMSWAVTYKYSLPDYYSLADYGMEAQASLLADYFILSRYGKERWFEVKLMQGIIGPDLKSRYEHVFKGFLNTPADRKNLK
ncbi:hypothetical protein ACJ8HP_14940 [Serratia sp. CY36935]|uniref:hypothetical protein n=1 Tax=Serratia sp. CY36935 TaxID=3383609 RepID=UPI003F9F3DFC